VPFVTQLLGTASRVAITAVMTAVHSLAYADKYVTGKLNQNSNA